MTLMTNVFILASLAVAAVEATAVRTATTLESPVDVKLNNIDNSMTFPPPGFTMVETQWEVEIRPGEKVQLNGTIQAVREQMLQLNPDFERDMADQMAARGAEQKLLGLDETKTTLGKRDHDECSGDYRPASAESINRGIDYLKSVNGAPSIDAGQCSRVSCSNGGGIGWCSFRGERYTVNSYGWIAGAAEIVVKDCSFPDMYGKDWVAGRRYHDAHVAVWVGSQQC